MRIPSPVCAVLALLLVGLSLDAGAQTSRLAPLAVAVMAQQNRPSVMGALANKGMVRPASGTQPARVTTLVRFSGTMPDVAAMGGRVLWESGDVAGVELPIGQLQILAQAATVRYVDVAVPVKPQLDLAVAATGADEVRSGTPPDWSGDTGRNVLIGFIDTGIDLSHLDFRNPQGGSRVIELIDYTTGTRCTGAQIDAGDCAEVDTEGHGTQVAGIAAGNGSATGNGQPAYRYIGMAPQAGLLVAKGDWTTANVVTAVQDLESVADSLGRPLVINLSLGTEIGPHDGTDNIDRALDNASGAGRILVIAAGNHADDDSHASGSVLTGGSVVIGAQVPVDTDLTVFDIWYAGADRMAVDVSNGTSCDSGTIAAPVSDTATESAFCAGRATIVSGSVNPLNGDREILITLAATADSPFVSNGWQITLTGTAISNGRFDAWTNGSTSGANFKSNLDPADTLSDLATASAPIAVASYNTRNTWVSLDGTMSAVTSNPLGAISYFSSAGPRRSCSLPLECPAVQKPDITAPGAWIAAAYSAQTVWPSGTCVDCYLDLDGVHSFRQGTSMAAPIVAGGVALLLQLAPEATPGQIKAYLDQYAATDDFVGAVPNDRWGYGKLDIKSAFDALPVAPPAAPTGLTAAPSGTSAILAWAANTAIDVDGYAIDRASVASGPYTQVGTVSYRSTTYTDSQLTSGTYYYTVRTLDTKGQESLPSAAVSAAVSATSSPTTVSTSSSGGGGCVFMPGEPFDPVLLGLVALGAIGQGVRAGRRHSQKQCRRCEEES